MARRGSRYIEEYLTPFDLGQFYGDKDELICINGVETTISKLATQGYHLAIKQNNRWTHTIKYTFHDGNTSSLSFKLMDNPDKIWDVDGLISHLVRNLKKGDIVSDCRMKSIKLTQRLSAGGQDLKVAEKVVASNPDFIIVNLKKPNLSVIPEDVFFDEAFKREYWTKYSGSIDERSKMLSQISEEELLNELATRADNKPKLRKVKPSAEVVSIADILAKLDTEKERVGLINERN